MSLVKCTKCGEMFSESYRECPFCAEDEEYYNGRVNKRHRRQAEKKKKAPSIVGPALILVIVLLLAVLVWTFFGEKIKGLFEVDTAPGTEQTDPATGTNPLATPTDTLVISSKTLVLAPGESAQLTVNGGERYEWSNSNPAVATVTESGGVTAVGEGTAVLTVISGEKSATCTVTVREAATGTDVTPGTPTTQTKVDVSKISIAVPLYGTSLPKISDGHFDVQLSRGESFGLKIEGTDVKPVWSCKNTSVASVSDDGTIKAISNGETTVEIKLNDVTVDILVRVR